MAENYIERREAGLYLTGTRIPIDSVVWEYRNGEEPETIQRHYPTLSLDHVNAAIAFYLAHREDVDHIIEQRQRSAQAWEAAHPTPPEIRQKFERMRQTLSRRS